MSWEVAAFAAHPDDAELNWGASLARFAAGGGVAGIVDLTAGERGSRGDPATRAREATAAARELGVAREGLGLPDLGLRGDDPAQVRVVVECLRRLRPRVVLAPHPDEGHPDHAATAALVRRAVEEARFWKADAGGERHVVEQLLFAWPAAGADQGGGAGGGGGWGGGLVIDVGDHFESKRRAILAYRSQFEGGDGPATRIAGDDFLALVEARARIAGAAVGARYGEGFVWRGALSTGEAVLSWLAGAGRAAAARRP